jgi:hypothetical protein
MDADSYDTIGITITGLKIVSLLEYGNPLAPRLVDCSTSATSAVSRRSTGCVTSI